MTLLGPRRATILAPLRGLAASLRVTAGAVAPADNMLEKATRECALTHLLGVF